MRKLATITTLALLLMASPAAAEDVGIEHGGLKLNGNLELADGKTVKDPVALVVHGTLAHNGMEIIATLQELLKERGVSSLAITLGLGMNDRRQTMPCDRVFHNHRHTDALDEIGLWLDWLKGQGNEQAILVGHSRGGNQVAWFAAEHDRPQVARVALIAPQLWNYDGVLKGYREFYKRSLPQILRAAKKQIDDGQGVKPLRFVDFLYCERTMVSADAFVSYYDDDPRMHTPNLIPKIAKPVLVVWGLEDKTVRGLDKHMEGIADGDKVRFTVVEDADHFFRDLFAEDLADAVAEFAGGGE